MAVERKLTHVGPVLFTADGGNNGLVTVTNTAGFKVKSIITLQATGITSLQVEVKRVLSKTQMFVGSSGDIKNKKDVSAFTVAAGASVTLYEQDRPNIPFEQHARAVFEEEPTLANRSLLVDIYGNPYSAANPLPTSGSGGGGSSGGLAPADYDLVDIIRDFEDDPSSYKFYLDSILIGQIDVSYNANKSSIQYKKVI